MGLREDKRLASMRRVQEAALELFEARGFEAVSVEEIAEAAGVGPASLYRHFGTKERLVLWDEYDPMLFETLARLLPSKRPFAAMVSAVSESLGSFYVQDRARILRRTNLAWKTPALRAQTLAELNGLREGLVEVLRRALPDRLERELHAAVFVTMLDRCIDEWRRSRGRTPLASLIERAARIVARLG
jgi:AcrR family transcriptional regulator